MEKIRKNYIIRKLREYENSKKENKKKNKVNL